MRRRDTQSLLERELGRAVGVAAAAALEDETERVVGLAGERLTQVVSASVLP